MTAPPEPTDDLQRLARDLAEAVEHQAATSEVIEVIGRSRFELEPVFETVVRTPCGCAAPTRAGLPARRRRVPAGVLLGASPEYRRLLEENPIARGSGTLVGRVGSERRTVQIEDAPPDPRYQWHEARDLGGCRTILGVPMLERRSGRSA